MSLEQENTPIDLRLLARWLGVDGARAGLEACRLLTIESLRQLAEGLDYQPPKSITRAQLIEELVARANRRIDRSLPELMKMSEDELLQYLEKVQPSREEILDLLRTIKASPTRDSHKELVRFAAREISETGRFISIASSGKGLFDGLDAGANPEKKKS